MHNNLGDQYSEISIKFTSQRHSSEQEWSIVLNKSVPISIQKHFHARFGRTVSNQRCCRRRFECHWISSCDCYWEWICWDPIRIQLPAAWTVELRAVQRQTNEYFDFTNVELGMQSRPELTSRIVQLHRKYHIRQRQYISQKLHDKSVYSEYLYG